MANEMMTVVTENNVVGGENRPSLIQRIFGRLAMRQQPGPLLMNETLMTEEEYSYRYELIRNIEDARKRYQLSQSNYETRMNVLKMDEDWMEQSIQNAYFIMKEDEQYLDNLLKRAGRENVSCSPSHVWKHVAQRSNIV